MMQKGIAGLWLLQMLSENLKQLSGSVSHQPCINYNLCFACLNFRGRSRPFDLFLGGIYFDNQKLIFPAAKAREYIRAQ